MTKEPVCTKRRVSERTCSSFWGPGMFPGRIKGSDFTEVSTHCCRRGGPPGGHRRLPRCHSKPRKPSASSNKENAWKPLWASANWSLARWPIQSIPPGPRSWWLPGTPVAVPLTTATGCISARRHPGDACVPLSPDGSWPFLMGRARHLWGHHSLLP